MRFASLFAIAVTLFASSLSFAGSTEDAIVAVEMAKLGLGEPTTKEAAKDCPCGKDCKCPAGTCPGGCPAVTIPDALDEVNALRASRGLRPFIRDEALTQAAQTCATVRAQALCFGHTTNDFAALPPGSHAASAGCAAYPASMGWLSCCTNENYTYGGAAYAMGADGKRYMHLFVGNTPNVVAVTTKTVTTNAEPVVCGKCGPNGCPLTSSGLSSCSATMSQAATTTTSTVMTAVHAHPVLYAMTHPLKTIEAGIERRQEKRAERKAARTGPTCCH